MNTGNSVQEADKRGTALSDLEGDLPGVETDARATDGTPVAGTGTSGAGTPGTGTPGTGTPGAGIPGTGATGMGTAGAGATGMSATGMGATGAGTQSEACPGTTRTPPSFQHVRDIQDLIDKLDAVTRQLRAPGHS